MTQSFLETPRLQTQEQLLTDCPHPSVRASKKGIRGVKLNKQKLLTDQKLYHVLGVVEIQPQCLFHDLF